ncbi:MAG: integrase [Nocardia sp.]|uniref:hypothetical protein n=1 Tax=Nocardia sp. TaxID=1821 RepID=UPI0026045038|nr:hypothetical protein [Nocardia sp.]MCU1642828.1 integrase [Nocardia sp.]
MTSSGIQQMLYRRGAAAGIGHLHPHQLRHFFAHNWLASGGQEQDLMMLAGALIQQLPPQTVGRGLPSLPPRPRRASRPETIKLFTVIG